MLRAMKNPNNSQADTHSNEQALNWLKAYSRSRDPEALHALVTCYQREMYSLAVFMLRGKADAEDAVQEACLSIIRQPIDSNRVNNVRNWLLGAVRNACLMQLRASRRRGRREEKVMNESNNTVNVSPGKNLEEIELREAVLEHVKTLPTRYRIAVFLRYYQGLSEQEVAEVLEEPAGTLRSQLSRGIEKIRSSLAISGVTLSATALLTTMSTTPDPTLPPTLVKRITEAVYDTKPVNHSAQHSKRSNTGLPTGLAQGKLILWSIGGVLLLAMLIASRYQTQNHNLPSNQPVTKNPSPENNMNLQTPALAPYSATWDFDSEPNINNTQRVNFWSWKSTRLGGALVIRKQYWGKFVGFALPHRLPNRPLLITCQVSVPKHPSQGRSKMNMGLNFIWRAENAIVAYRSWTTTTNVRDKRITEITTLLLDHYAIQKVDGAAQMVFKFEPSTQRTHLSMLVRNWSIHHIAVRELKPGEYEATYRDPEAEIKRLAQEPDCSISTPAAEQVNLSEMPNSIP